MKRMLNVWNRAVLAWGAKLYLALALSVVLMATAVYPVYAPFFEKQKDWMALLPFYGTIACLALIVWTVHAALYSAMSTPKRVLAVAGILLFIGGYLASSISWTDRAIAYYKSQDIKISAKECKAGACQKQDLTPQSPATPPKSPWPFAKENRAGWERLTLSMGIMATLTMAILGLFAFAKTVFDLVQQLKTFSLRRVGTRSLQVLNQAKISFKRYDQDLRASVEDKVLRSRLRLKNAKELESPPIRDAL